MAFVFPSYKSSLWLLTPTGLAAQQDHLQYYLCSFLVVIATIALLQTDYFQMIQIPRELKDSFLMALPGWQNSHHSLSFFCLNRNVQQLAAITA